MFILIATVFLLVIHQGQCGMNATAVLHPDNSVVTLGTLIFTQEDADAPVHITGSFVGLNASSAHGFHIHVYPVSDGSPNCTEAGPHFNPYNTTHGPRTANITSRHVGDLGNITADGSGNIDLDMTDSIIQLYNATQSILSRTAIIHLLRDDGGEGGALDSNTTGNAGPRIICGLIKLSSEDPTTTTIETSTTTTETSTTTTESSTTATSASTTSSITPATTTTGTTTTSTNASSTPRSAGLTIQPVMFVLIITAIIAYLIHY